MPESADGLVADGQQVKFQESVTWLQRQELAKL